MPYSIIVSLTRIFPGTTQILFTININTRLQSHDLSTPLPLGAYLLSYPCQQGHQQLINQCLNQDMIHTVKIPSLINATTNGCNLFSYRCQQEHQQLIYQCLNQDTIHNRFVKTVNDYSLAVNSTESLYQLYFFSLDQNWVFNRVITSYALSYITQLSNHILGPLTIYVYTNRHIQLYGQCTTQFTLASIFATYMYICIWNIAQRCRMLQITASHDIPI